MKDVTLKDKIMLLYNNKQLRDELGNYGHDRVVEFFNWKKNVIIYKNVLKNTIKEYDSK